MFYDNFVSLCTKTGKSPSAVAEEIGFKRSVVTRWSKGSMPRDATLHRISNYFNVPVSALIQEKPTPDNGGGPMPPEQYATLTLDQREFVDEMIRSLAAKNTK